MGAQHEGLLKLREEKRRKKELHRERCKFVSERWALLRLLRGSLTQAELAGAAGVPISYVGMVERGKPWNIGAEALWRLLSVYASLGDEDGLR